MSELERAAVEGEAYPETIVGREYWVNWILDGYGQKRPVAPWKTGHAYPVEWNGDLSEEERPETDFTTAKRWADFDLGDADLQLPDDAQSDSLDTGLLLPNDRPPREERITLIDWDDVRDADTEEIHPVAADYIQRFGGYVEVSTSGEGLHQFVLGGLRKRGKFIAPIDDEPFVGDDLPQVEIYDGGRHVAMTGRHVAGSDDDVLDDGQPMIDELVTEYASAEVDAGHRVYDPETGSSVGDTDTDGGGHVPDPESVDYSGPTIEEYRATKPDDRGFTYHVAVEAFYRGAGNSGGYAGIQNWRLEGFAAALGERDGLTPEEVKRDLGGRYLDETDVERRCEHRTPERIDYAHKRAAKDRLQAPSWETLAAYGVIPPEAVDDAEPVAPLPSGHLDALSPAERKRAVRKRGVDIPSTRDARQRLRDAVFRELRAGNTTVLDAPTAMGKSYGVATEPWRMRDSTTGGAPVVHLHETTDARDDTAEDTLESDATGAVLRGRKEASPLARGDHDPTPDGESDPDIVVTIDGRPASEWFDHQCDDKGLPFSTALALARDRNDQGLDELPPVGQEDPAVAQWDGLPRDEDGEPAVDVIHATHQFAYVPSLRSHTNVVLDEQPDYTVDLAQERIRRMVNAFLREIDAPVSTFGALTTLARSHGSGDAGREADAVDELLSHDTDHGLGTEWFFSDPDAHALAPDLTRALWKALRYSDPDANGRVSEKVWHEPPRFDADEESYNAGTWLSVVVDEQNTIRQVRSTPDFSQARAVIGLDAHPSMSHWQLNGAPGMVRDAVLDPTERRLWRRFERGLTTVQVGDATRPRSGQNAREWMNDDRVRAVIEAIRERHGSGFKTALSTAQTERAVRELLGEVAPGVDDESTMHFGEEKSRNDFADEDAGYVYGCMDPGDAMVLDVIAELGLDATPETATDEDGAEYRAKGRAFVGSDADTAASILASVRENHVAQAAGRYARNADDPDDRATVYIHTDATPTGFVDVEAPGVQWLATDLQREILEELSTRASATTREIADVVGCSKEHVRETLQHLEDDDVVSRDVGSGPYGADVYHDDGAESARVDVGDRQHTPTDHSRWSLAIAAPHADGSPLTPASASSSEADDAAMAGDDPPGGEWWRGDHRE